MDTLNKQCKTRADCPIDQYCDKDLATCKEGECFDNTDCGEGYLCDSSRHYCYFIGCSKNSDCKEGICKKSNGKCIDCLTDSDCKSGSCDSSMNICLAGNCKDDKLEPNDSFNQAYPIGSGIRKAVLCPSDNDYFKIDLSAQDGLRVIIKTFSIKDIKTELYSSKDMNNPVIFANISNLGELNLLSAPLSGEYYIKITATDVIINYEIEFIIKKPSINCEDDIFEENDSEDQAKNIAPGIYKNLLLCPLDGDYFAITLNAKDQINIIINGEDIDAEIYSSQNKVHQKIGLNSKTGFNIDTSGIYYLKITPLSSQQSSYSFELNIKSNNICIDDAFEENDDFLAPRDIPLNRENELTLCPYDEDWFIFKTLGRPTRIALVSENRLRFEIYSTNDRDEPILYSEEYDRSTQVAEFEGLPNTLLLRVPANSVENKYRLKISSDVTDCIDDTLEPNDSLEEARHLSSGDYQNLKICSGDEDFYSFDLNSGDRIEITASFSNTQADIDILLVDPMGREVAHSISSTDNEKIDHTASHSGRYILNVFTWDNASAPYSINAKISTRGSLCPDDRFEDNDSLQRAARLSSTEIYGLTICPQDYDYYSIALNKDDRLSVGIFYNESMGRLYATLLSSDGRRVFSTGEARTGDIILNLTASYSGEYILLIRGARDEIKNDYDILIGIRKNNQCIDDRFEDNDSLQYAPSIASQSMDSLVMCPDETDIYRILLETGDTILVDSSVTSSGSYNYSLLLLSPQGSILDSDSGDRKDKSVIAEAAGSGYYYINLKNNSSERLLYRLALSIDGMGGRSGDETTTLYPLDSIDRNNPRLYEIIFSRLPQNAVIKDLYISLIVEHNRPGDIIITAQYADQREETLWDGSGGATDNGFDDDKEDDADIEIYNRILSSAKGLPADKSLLILIEDYSTSTGRVFAIEGRVFWEVK